MHLHIDVSWLLDVQEVALGSEDMSVEDYSALVAAVARHKTRLPTLQTADPDAAWRAAALMHTIVRLEPLPHRNSLYAASSPPSTRTSPAKASTRPPETAERIRSWKI